MGKKLTYSSDKCIGCHYCEISCSLEHFGECGRNRALIHIATDFHTLANMASFCRHCKKPVCIGVCPVSALSRNEKTGVIGVDSRKCIGCGVCVEKCPLGGLHIDEDLGRAISCDLCNGNPTCVEFCPRQALRYD